MMQYVRFMSLWLITLTVPVSAASFDCDKATIETEIAICADPELSALDELMANAWELQEPETRLNEQRRFLLERNACGDRSCLLRLMGIRVGQLLAYSAGLQDRIKKTPFRFVPPKTVFVRCRRNYQGGDTLKYAELLFSFEEDGATFQETNILVNGKHSESVWDWLIWNASASNTQINISAYSQSVLRRSYSVTEQYIRSLQHGSMFSWIIYENEEQGAAFLTFNFDTANDVKNCIALLDRP